MSSNLLKQRYIVSESSDAVMINSNRRMEERMRELIRLYQLDQPAPDNDGFVEGITAEQEPPQPKIDPEELIAKAQAEANELLENAKLQAQQIISDADGKVRQLFEEQKQLGYEEGIRAGASEIENRKRQLQTENDAFAQSLAADYQNQLQTMESDLIDVLIQVFDKVFHIQFEDKKDILLYLAHNTLMNIDAGKHFRIRVSEQNRLFMEEHLPMLQEEFGSEVTIEIVRDVKLKDTDCQIETDFGVFDCGMDVELTNLLRDIRSLCI